MSRRTTTIGCMMTALAASATIPAARGESPKLEQPQVSLNRLGSKQWNAAWEAISGRTYFVQTSADLKSWKYEPVVRNGSGTLRYEFTSQAPSLYLRLQYVDILTYNAGDSDFDGDGLTNLQEVSITHSDPLDPASHGEDTDHDGLPDGWEIAEFGNIESQSASDDPDGDNLNNLAEFQLRLKPTQVQQIGTSSPIVVTAPLAGNGTSTDPLRLADGSADGNMLQWSQLAKSWKQVAAPPFFSATLGTSAVGKSYRVNSTGTGWNLRDREFVDVMDYGAGGNDSTDDSQALINAVAAAKTANRMIYLPAGKTFRITKRIVLDARSVRIMAYGAAIRCVGDNAGLYIGSEGMATMQITIEGLEIVGDGYSAGNWISPNQILIDCHNTGGKNITLRDMRISDSKIGFRSQMTDYLQLEKILWRGNGTHWYGGYSTNVSFARGCAFIGKNAKQDEVTDKHCHFVDVDTCIFLNSEFGDGNYGLYIDSSGPGVNNMVTWKNCRTERLKIRDIQAGTGTPGTGGAQPVNIVVEQSVFMGVGASDPPARTHYIEVNQCTNFIMRDSYGVQMKTGTDLVRVPNANAAVASRVRMEQCGTTANCYVFRGPDGVTSSNQLISYGQDGSATVPVPLGLAFRAPDSVNTDIELPVAVMPRAGNRASAGNGGSFTVASGNTSDSANYWTIELRLRVSGVDAGLPICRTDTRDGRLSSPFVASSSLTTSGMRTYLNSQSVIVLKAYKTGNPTPLSGLCGTLFYDPTTN